MAFIGPGRPLRAVVRGQRGPARSPAWRTERADREPGKWHRVVEVPTGTDRDGNRTTWRKTACGTRLYAGGTTVEDAFSPPGPPADLACWRCWPEVAP